MKDRPNVVEQPVDLNILKASYKLTLSIAEAVQHRSGMYKQ